jgi:iron complex transport system ATP-binding protein
VSSVRAEQISVAYDDNVIIDGLSIAIPLKKTTTIIGPNGCGKSTLLKAIGRILDLKKGSIYIDCNDIHRLSTKELARQMAILPQSPIAPEGVTVEELISYGRFPHQKGLGKLSNDDKEIIQWAMKATNLEKERYQTVDSLSGGQRQRVWIAMALAQETEIILLDEPTTYLDMAYQLEVLELLEELNQSYGSTIVMVLHDLNLASRFADYMVALRNGKIVSAGSPEEVMTHAVLKEVYQIDANIVKDAISNRPLCMSYQLLKTERQKEWLKERQIKHEIKQKRRQH